MPILTKESEQLKLRQDISTMSEGTHAELHSKFTSAAVQSSATFAVVNSVDQLKKTIVQHKQELSALKRSDRPSGGNGNAPASKKQRGNSRPKWTSLKQDQSLFFCGAFDKDKRQQCGWNNDHHWGEKCPVYKSNPDYRPRFWGPQESGWDETKASSNVPINELKPLYKRDVDRWVKKNAK